MRYRKLPEPEEKMFYSSPVHPTIYKLRTNHSSQRFLFHYSVIENDPVSYEPDLTPGPIEYTDMRTDSRRYDMIAEKYTDISTNSRCYDMLAEKYTDISTDSGCYDMLAKVDFTMEDPDTYIEWAGKLSESSDAQQSVKET